VAPPLAFLDSTAQADRDLRVYVPMLVGLSVLLAALVDTAAGSVVLVVIAHVACNSAFTVRRITVDGLRTQPTAHRRHHHPAGPPGARTNRDLTAPSDRRQADPR
jgi:predicted lysophospholipase L1 biosynthesis ABC-type transport system permease subunit